MKRKCGDEEEPRKKAKNDTSVEIWTDGSHIKGTDRIGGGIYIESYGGKKTGRASVPLTSALLKRFLPDMPDEEVAELAFSNPTAELYAAILAGEWLEKHLSNFSSAKLYADYNGVHLYALGKERGGWDANNASPKTPAFAVCAKRWQELVARIQEQIPFDVQWVRGHAGNVGNNIADKLAKKHGGENSLDDAI